MEQDSERKNVGAMVERAARCLLGRHVGGRPHYHAYFRSAVRGHGGVSEVGAANILGKAEVEHLDPAFMRDHDVGRLQVAMHDAFLMRRSQRIPQSAGDLDDLFEGKPACADEPVERLTFDELHGQEVDAVGFLHRVDGDDVRVVELGQSLRLAAKARQPLGILRHLGGQDFECYVAAELRVGGAIHLAHAARAERRQDFIGAEFCPMK